MAEGRDWLFLAELDATRRPEGTRRSRPGRGPGPAGSEATPGELPALERRGERPRGNRGRFGCRLSPRPRVRRDRASRVPKSSYPAPCARRGLPAIAAEAGVCRTLVDPGRGRGPGAKGTAWGRCPRARCLQMRGPGHTGRRPGRGAGALPRLPARPEAGLGEGGPGSPRQPGSRLARPEAPASPGRRSG